MQRSTAAIWVYVTANLVLNIVAGLFIGSRKSPSTTQESQYELFSTFACLISTVPSAQQLQTQFIASRTVNGIRERPSKMYSWITFRLLVGSSLSCLETCSAVPCFSSVGTGPWDSQQTEPDVRSSFTRLLPFCYKYDHWTGGCSYCTDVGYRRSAVHIYVLARLAPATPFYSPTCGFG